MAIERIRLAVENLRAIGDSSDLSNTFESSTMVEWSATSIPTPIELPIDRPGIYSLLAFELDGELSVGSYVIEGRVALNGVSRRFSLSDRDESVVSRAMQLTIEPGDAPELALVLDLSGVIAAVDFSSLRDDDQGVLVLDDQQDEAGAVRARMENAFSVSGP